MIKTYAVRGLLEWRLTINAEGVTIPLHFTGGSMGINGILPARFTTSNKVLQLLIEKTPEFLSNRVFLYAARNEKTDYSTRSSGKRGDDPNYHSLNRNNKKAEDHDSRKKNFRTDSPPFNGDNPEYQ